MLRKEERAAGVRFGTLTAELRTFEGRREQMRLFAFMVGGDPGRPGGYVELHKEGNLKCDRNG